MDRRVGAPIQSSGTFELPQIKSQTQMNAYNDAFETGDFGHHQGSDFGQYMDMNQ